MADATSLSLENSVKWKLLFKLEELQPIEQDTWSTSKKNCGKCVLLKGKPDSNQLDV